MLNRHTKAIDSIVSNMDRVMRDFTNLNRPSTGETVMMDYLIDYAFPLAIIAVTAWMAIELYGAHRDCGRFEDID